MFPGKLAIVAEHTDPGKDVLEDELAMVEDKSSTPWVNSEFGIDVDDFPRVIFMNRPSGGPWLLDLLVKAFLTDEMKLELLAGSNNGTLHKPSL